MLYHIDNTPEMPSDRFGTGGYDKRYEQSGTVSNEMPADPVDTIEKHSPKVTKLHKASFLDYFTSYERKPTTQRIDVVNGFLLENGLLEEDFLSPKQSDGHTT